MTTWGKEITGIFGFLKQFICQHQMHEGAQNGGRCLPFLDFFVYRKMDGIFRRKVYQKPTHTSLYFNYVSHHHPVQMRAVLLALAQRAKGVSDSQEEVRHVVTSPTRLT